MSVSKEFLPQIIHPFYFIRTGIYQAIKERAELLTGVLLDFGCGQKPYKSLFKVDKYIGIDFENPGHNHENENIDVLYDGKSIPFDDNYFDSILCSEVFEHLFDIDYTLQEVNRVLKKGGKLLVTCPFVWNEHEIPHDYARYTIFALTHLFNKHGFNVINSEKKGSFIQAITQIRVLYFYYNINPLFLKFPGGRYISNLFIATLNSIGIVKDYLYPQKKDFYLSNVFLVEKL